MEYLEPIRCTIEYISGSGVEIGAVPVSSNAIKLLSHPPASGVDAEQFRHTNANLSLHGCASITWRDILGKVLRLLSWLRGNQRKPADTARSKSARFLKSFESLRKSKQSGDLVTAGMSLLHSRLAEKENSTDSSNVLKLKTASGKEILSLTPKPDSKRASIFGTPLKPQTAVPVEEPEDKADDLEFDVVVAASAASSSSVPFSD